MSKKTRPTFVEKWRQQYDGDASGLPVARLASSRLESRILNTVAATRTDFGRDINGAVEVSVQTATVTRPQIAFLSQHKTTDLAKAKAALANADATAVLRQAMKPIDEITLPNDPVPALEEELSYLRRLYDAAGVVAIHVEQALINAVRTDGIPKCKAAYKNALKPLDKKFDIGAATDLELDEETREKMEAAMREQLAKSVADVVEDIFEIYVVAISVGTGLDSRERNALETAWAQLPSEMPTIEDVRNDLYGDHRAKKDAETQAAFEAQKASEKEANQKFAAENTKHRRGGQERAPEWASEGPPPTA